MNYMKACSKEHTDKIKGLRAKALFLFLYIARISNIETNTHQSNRKKRNNTMKKLIENIRFNRSDKLFNKLTEQHEDYINEEAPELQGDLISAVANEVNRSTEHAAAKTSEKIKEAFDKMLAARQETRKEYSNITWAVFTKGYANGQKAGRQEGLVAGATAGAAAGAALLYVYKTLQGNKMFKEDREAIREYLGATKEEAKKWTKGFVLAELYKKSQE